MTQSTVNKEKMGKPYVMHICKSNDCNNAWLDMDEYNATAYPPKWRYCPDCKAKGLKEKKDPAKILRGQELADQMKKKRSIPVME